MITDFPEAPESVALALMQMIEGAEKRNGRRRGKLSERERLLSLYKDCLSVVTGTERKALHTLH